MDGPDWSLSISGWIPGQETSPEIALAALLGLLAGVVLGGAGVSILRARGEGRMRDRFQALAGEALDRSSERFLALAGERLGALERAGADELARREAAVEALVRPLRESLARVDEKLQRVETERHGHQAALTRHLELLAAGHRALGTETRKLGEALRSPQVRGR